MNADVILKIKHLKEFLEKEKDRPMNDDVREEILKLIQQLEEMSWRIFHKLTKKPGQT